MTITGTIWLGLMQVLVERLSSFLVELAKSEVDEGFPF
jgi:hypothetical protein